MHQKPSREPKEQIVLLQVVDLKCLDPSTFGPRTTSRQILRPRNLVRVVRQVIHRFSKILHVHIRVYHIPSPFPSVLVLEHNQRPAPIMSHSTFGCRDSTLVSAGSVVQEVILHPHFEWLLCFSPTNVILEELGRCHSFVIAPYMFFEPRNFEVWFRFVRVLSVPVAYDPYK